MSAIELLKSWGYKVSERAVSIDEIAEAYDNGNLKESFGTGTAAVVSPVGELCRGEEKIIVSGNKIGPVAQKMYDTLTGIQYGRVEDPFGWIVKLS